MPSVEEVKVFFLQLAATGAQLPLEKALDQSWLPDDVTSLSDKKKMAELLELVETVSTLKDQIGRLSHFASFEEDMWKDTLRLSSLPEEDFTEENQKRFSHRVIDFRDFYTNLHFFVNRIPALQEDEVLEGINGALDSMNLPAIEPASANPNMYLARFAVKIGKVRALMIAEFGPEMEERFDVDRGLGLDR
jgi:hypothetical protein